ncbi:MAG: autotransporter outer membrane beta-barrel domain-containing protein, partial [Planctomycetaceae bacterium]|nr:autotransporter outer membrane beta-barrel domain-containing protein [Planctomycetaceae bacterium]
ESFAGWNVIRYKDGLFGKFTGVDTALSPYYDFSLDYDTDGYIKINGDLRNAPNELSDIVVTSLAIAQTRMYRSAYQQISREWMSECPEHPQYRGSRGTAARTAWMNFIGRGEDFTSNYHRENYNFQSYGVQAGMSFLSNCNHSFGLLFGREEGKLNNSLDEVRNEDYYLGFYYGQVFASGLDMRAYIGGGWQDNRLTRTHHENRFKAGYDGNTYNMDIEFGRRFIGTHGWIVRPFTGADLQVSRIGGALEKSVDVPDSNEYREYKRSELTMLFLRLGLETSRSWQKIDFHAGTNLAYNIADARPFQKIYYPAAEGIMVRNWVEGGAARLGRFEWAFNLGMNWFLSERRNTLFFLDYNADVYLDRSGDTSAGTGTLGFVWRF